ncbi:MAG: mandelate racemase/muconate lactonizing enzyme family protein [Synergistaceae bacterium]|jgi:L-alanine-DL-glutamate epimerase-like enolase superfamily enzyme|nr:mandelate racemase/muconate lactonizing enzyme family protein [Synergistaceae bacterium]
MIIKKIETFSTQNLCIVRVTTDDGFSGWGQTAPITADITAQIVHRLLAPLVLGKSCDDMQALEDSCVDSRYTFHGTYLFRALAGIDAALWDIKGKKEGKSVAQLFGSDRKFVDVYGSSMVKEVSPQWEVDRIKKLMQEQGIKAFKLHINKPGEYTYSLYEKDTDVYPGRTEELITLFRKTFGPDVPLMIDSNGSFSVKRAIEIGHFFEDMGVEYFEEPCPYWDFEKNAAVAKALKVPIAGGEQDYNMAQWKRIIDSKSVYIAQPDIGYIGGFTRAMQVAKMTEDAGIICSPHNFTCSLLLVYCIHMNAILKNGHPFLEYSIDPEEVDPWSNGLFTPFPDIHDGKVAVPQEPGWGVELNEEWLMKSSYAVSEI